MEDNSQKPVTASNKGFQQSAFHSFLTLGFALAGLGLFAKNGPEWVDAILRASNWGTYPVANPWIRLPFALLGGIIGVFLGSLLIRAIVSADGKWKELEEGQKVTAVLSIIIGLFVAVTSITIFSALNLDRRIVGLLVIVIWGVATASLVYALETMTDILPWYKGKGRSKRTGVKIRDTNVLIDGRI